MRIPVVVKLGGHTLRTNRGNEEFEDYLDVRKDGSEERPFAKTWMGGEVILIDRAISRQQQEESFLHEVLHHIFFRMGRQKECDDEQLVQGLAAWLYAFLKDNQLVK